MRTELLVLGCYTHLWHHQRQTEQDVSITTSADTVAYCKARRGLHPLPAQKLLTPGTDDLERGKAIPLARVLHGAMHLPRLLLHEGSPPPWALPP